MSTYQPFEEDIGPPTARFMRFVRQLDGFPFLNRWTMPTFMAVVRQRFGRRR